VIFAGKPVVRLHDVLPAGPGTTVGGLQEF
jgi:hypothetical protein